MRSLVTNESRPTTQATAHSLHPQAWAAITRPLAGQRQSAVGLHLRNPSINGLFAFCCLVVNEDEYILPLI